MIGKGRDLSKPLRELVIPVRANLPQRLDRYLDHSLNWKSRNLIQRLIRGGRITVNGASCKPARRVRTGDVVVVQLSDGTGVPDSYHDADIPAVYEDAWLVGVNKPPAMLVHPAGKHVYDTLMNYMHHRYHGHATPDGTLAVPRLCHRLDRDTTGVIVIAKSGVIHKDIEYQFENRLVQKRYLALVHGSYPRDAETIDIPIGEGPSLNACLNHSVLRPSQTAVRVVERFRKWTLLTCRPFTGRANQIRIHLAAAGHPIAGDIRFGSAGPELGFPDRYLLHSHSLRFYHPRLKSWVELTAPAPEDLAATLEKLRAENRILPDSENAFAWRKA